MQEIHLYSNISYLQLLSGHSSLPRLCHLGILLSQHGGLQAGAAVMSEPEVRHLVLPETGGRIIIASDGLWDAINPKTAAHHVRGTPASKAAHDLVRSNSSTIQSDLVIVTSDTVTTRLQ